MVREDPKRRGLLFAGSEQAVYVSFDDGDHWQSLRVNMPATSIRDLVIKDDDLVVGTHGPLVLDSRRHHAAAADRRRRAGARPTHLFTPQAAWRFRWNKNTDTPLPPDEPAGQNPPDGAILHYRLSTRGRRGHARDPRRAGGGRAPLLEPAMRPSRRSRAATLPDYWIRPPQALRTSPGLHRFVWDLRHPAPAVASYSYPIAAIAGDTPRTPQGTLVAPGTYTARLRVDGAESTAPLVVRMDPRVKTTAGRPAAPVRDLAGHRRGLDARGRDLAGRAGERPVGEPGPRPRRWRRRRSRARKVRRRSSSDRWRAPTCRRPRQMLAAWKETASAIDAAITAWERRQAVAMAGRPTGRDTGDGNVGALAGTGPMICASTSCLMPILSAVLAFAM